MNPSRSVPSPAPRPASEPSPGLLGSWVRFWFSPVDPVGLHAVRVLSGLVFLAWLLSFAGSVDSWFGPQGWFDQKAVAEASRFPAPERPTLLGTWSLLSLAGPEGKGLTALYWGSVVVVALFSAGLWTRLSAVLTWLVVGTFTSNLVLDNDANALLNLLSFYLMIGYVLAPWRAERSRPSIGANVALRLLQVHLALVMVVSGLHKLQFGDWWAGVAFWYPLWPPFETTVEAVRKAHGSSAETYLGLLSVAAYLNLAWQLTFPLFAWRKRWWRAVLIGGAVLGGAGAAWLYQMPFFGAALVVGCTGFLSPAEWRFLIAGVRSFLPGKRSQESAQVLTRPEAAARADGIVPVAVVGRNG